MDCMNTRFRDKQLSDRSIFSRMLSVEVCDNIQYGYIRRWICSIEIKETGGYFSLLGENRTLMYFSISHYIIPFLSIQNGVIVMLSSMNIQIHEIAKIDPLHMDSQFRNNIVKYMNCKVSSTTQSCLEV